MGKYNIAFVPKYKINDFVKLAIPNLNSAASYMLGKASIPHVTICQFEYEEENLDELCEKICREYIDCDLTLSFKDVSYITFDKSIYWVSLLPEKTASLHDLFANISKIVTPLRTDKYDPHLTLFNYFLKDNSNGVILNKDINIEDEFELIIGESDSVGQLTKIVKILSETCDSTLKLC